MNKRLIAIRGIFLFLALLGIASCKPVEIGTVWWEPDGNGFIQFQTNDPENAEQGHVKLYDATNENPMTVVEVTVKKMLGTTGGGFGIVFCALDDFNYYKILITIGGSYKASYSSFGSNILVYTNGNDGWEDSVYLNTDLWSENTIKVTLVGSVFTLFLNGFQVKQFASYSGYEYGKAGFYAYVSSVSDEYLPSGQVDVRFKMTSPVAIP